MGGLREQIIEQLEFQARSCRWIGSPLYERLITAATHDAAAGGHTWSILEPYAGDPEGSALVLRFMASVHRLVLSGRAPDLAAFYPSAGGDASGEGAERAFLDTVAGHADELRADMVQPLQTNEPGRSAGLVGGFLTVASRFGLPLNVLEIGASAGLNLRWDRFLYEARGRTWGDPQSPVRLCDYNSDAPPPFDVDAVVASRRGCDPRPIDPTTEEGATLLLSFVWPDRLARIRLLRGAIEVARRVPAVVDRSPASDWLEGRLARSPGVATVVFHSLVVQYLDDAERAAVERTIEAAGAAATADAPFAHLRMEPDYEVESKVVDVRLRTWPGGTDELLAHTGYHGTAVRWLA